MFEMADRLIGIFKTHNTSKSVAINPKVIAAKGLAEQNTLDVVPLRNTVE